MSIRSWSSLSRWGLRFVVLAALVSSLPRTLMADSLMANSWNDARTALQSLDAYLRRHPTGPGWREYLQLPALAAELKKENSADRAAIYATLGSLNSGADGLQLPRFAPLRQALYAITLSNPADLAAAFTDSKGKFRPVTDADIQAARKNLDQKLTALQTHLNRTPSTGPGWISFLKLNELTAELARGEEADYYALKYDYYPGFKGFRGMEHPRITEAASALLKYADLLTSKLDPQISGGHDQRMERLAALTAQLAQPAGYISTDELGQLLEQTATSQQNPELIAAARRLFHQPNFVFSAKKKIVAAAMESRIDETAPLTDSILGTSIRGTSHTQANMFLNLRNNPNRAEFDINLRGTVDSRTAGFNGPAVVYSRGTTAINGHKLIWLDEEGMHTADNATATANTSTTFTGFGATRGLFPGIVTNVASKRAYQSKGTAERIAASHAEDRVENRLDEQAPQMIANANRDMRKNLRDPLHRYGIYPEKLQFSSTTEAVSGKALAANTFQLGAPTPPPQITVSVPYDIEFRLHETAVNNSAFTVFAGRKISRDELILWHQNNNLEFSNKFQNAQENNWSFTFDIDRPLHFAFQKVETKDGLKDGFKVQLRGSKWDTGFNEREVDMEITAVYFFDLSSGKLKVVRDSLEILPPGHVKGQDVLTPEQTGLKGRLTTQFEKILEPVYSDEGIKLKGRLASYGKLFFRDMKSENGWLQAALGK